MSLYSYLQGGFFPRFPPYLFKSQANYEISMTILVGRGVLFYDEPGSGTGLGSIVLKHPSWQQLKMPMSFEMH